MDIKIRCVQRVALKGGETFSNLRIYNSSLRLTAIGLGGKNELFQQPQLLLISVFKILYSKKKPNPEIQLF
jgi:hypothetical protein